MKKDRKPPITDRLQAVAEAARRFGKDSARYKDFMAGWTAHNAKDPETNKYGTSRRNKARWYHAEPKKGN